MRIGIDAWPLADRPTGIGRYVRELCLDLPAQMPEAEFFLYSPRPIDFPSQPRVHVRQDRGVPFLPGYGWLKWRAGRLCARDRLDVFWATRTLAPQLPARVAVVATVYDLNHRVVPQTMPIVNRWAHRLWFRSDVKSAAVVAAISQGTSDRLAVMFGRAADAVIRPAVSSRYRPQAPRDVAACLARHGIEAPYILGVGTPEPRKNLHTLVQAYAALSQRGALQHRLVLIGGHGWKNRDLERALAGQGGIHRLGYVPEDELPLLYSGADLFVFPSIYEGFGIPVLEARACGTRIVASDIPELREAGGDDGCYVVPTMEGLIHGIGHAIRQAPHRTDRNALPSWHASAEALARVLRSAASGA